MMRKQDKLAKILAKKPVVSHEAIPLALVACSCGEFEQEIAVDGVSGATFIECLSCHRAVCGIHQMDAQSMWNGAFKVRG